MESKIRLFATKNKLIQVLFSLLLLTLIGSCTTLVKKEYELTQLENEQHDNLIALLKIDQDSGYVHGFEFYDSERTKLWVRFFPENPSCVSRFEKHLDANNLLYVEKDTITDSLKIQTEELLLDTLKDDNITPAKAVIEVEEPKEVIPLFNEEEEKNDSLTDTLIIH